MPRPRGAPPLTHRSLLRPLLLATFLTFCHGAAAQDRPSAAAIDANEPARDLFGASRAPSLGQPRSIGSYAKGCLAGAAELAPSGPAWVTMRPSRDRAYGHPALIAWLERFAAEAAADGWPGLLVGDLAQPRGGPMPSGHASHQIGLDADLWLTPRPARPLDRAARETMGAPSMLRDGSRSVDPGRFGASQVTLLRRAARAPEVARIFVHPGIKKALCDAAGPADRGWLAKIRPWWGHDAHFHVRLACPAGEGSCAGQDPIPPGDGCGGELAWWLSDEPWVAKGPPKAPPPPLRIADLPAACAGVLAAPSAPRG